MHSDDNAGRQRLRLTIPVATIVRVLIAFAVLLVILSYSGQLAVRAFDWHPERDIVHFFNLDRERNLPTTFQTLLFLGSTVTLAAIAVMARLTGDRWTRHWAFLSLLFALLAWDEIAEIHERFINPVRSVLDLGGIFFFAWIVPAIVFVLVVGLIYLRFVLALVRPLRERVIVAGAIFISGALVMEAIGGWYYESIDQATDMIYVTIATVEESLEMAGLILFLWALLCYLSSILPGRNITITGEPGSLYVDAERNVPPPGR